MKKKWLLPLIFIGIHICCTAQNPLNRTISIEFKNSKIESALLQLVENHDVPLSFSNYILPEQPRITATFQQSPVADILNNLFAGTQLTYQLIGDEIVILVAASENTKRYTLTGRVTDASSGEYLIGANVYLPNFNRGTITNDYGFYKINLPARPAEIVYSYLGYDRTSSTVFLNSDETKDVALSPSFLAEVLVLPEMDSFYIRSTNGSRTLNLAEAAVLPSLAGETDIVRLLDTYTGVNAGPDGFGGISVRGGNVDQNLFLLDGVPVYNPLHAVGLFSVFNTNAIRSVRFYKGVSPARFGGRLSSVLDVQTKEGNRNRHVQELDMGLTSVNLSFQGPLGNRASYFFSARRSLVDFYSGRITENIRAQENITGSLFYLFYDLNTKLNYEFSDNSQIYISLYRGGDRFEDVSLQNGEIGDTLVLLNEEEEIKWGNTVGSIRWNKKFNNNLFFNATATYTRFFYRAETSVDLNGEWNDSEIYRDVLYNNYDSKNADWALKTDFDYRFNNKQAVSFGTNFIRHQFTPGVISTTDSEEYDEFSTNGIGDIGLPEQISYELDAYFSTELMHKDWLQADLGIRFSALSSQGSWQFSPQPRLLFKFLPNQPLSVHLAAGIHTQNLHLLNSTSFGLPKDIWVAATDRRPSQQAYVLETGLRCSPRKGWQTSIEGFYKRFENLLAFQETLLETINADIWENEVFAGEGRAYGVELLLEKTSGKTTGRIGYTFSNSTRIFDQPINRGDDFPIRLDLPHNFNLQIAHRLNRKWSLSLGWKIAAGAAYTQPSSEYTVIIPPSTNQPEVVTIDVLDVESKNGSRLPDYHRLDVSANFRWTKKKNIHQLKMGFYNIYNRFNPIYRTTRDRLEPTGNIRTDFIEVSILPIFPTLRYRIQFFTDRVD